MAINRSCRRKTSLPIREKGGKCALSDGVVNLSSVETLSRYRLGTSGNIRILKGALKKRDLIEETGHRAEIQDPVFKQNPAGSSRNRRDFGVKKVG